MLRIKILNRKNHPFTHAIKIYGMSIEVILTISFLAVVVFATAVYISQVRRKRKEHPAKQQRRNTSVLHNTSLINYCESFQAKIN